MTPPERIALAPLRTLTREDVLSKSDAISHDVVHSTSAFLVAHGYSPTRQVVDPSGGVNACVD